MTKLEAEVRRLKSANEQLQKELNEEQSDKKKIKEAIATLIKVANVGEKFECPICYNEIEQQNQVVLVPCGHRQVSKIMKHKNLTLCLYLKSGSLNL